MSAWDAVEIGSASWGPGRTDGGDGEDGSQADHGVPNVNKNMDRASATGSDYPETKDAGDGATTETGDGLGVVAGGRWAPFQPSEQAVTQGPASEPSVVMITKDADHGVTGMTASGRQRRHTMAFEIARVERARSRSKVSPPNPLRAGHIWFLSRPRFVERSDQPGRRIRLLPGQEHRDAVPYGVWGTSWAQMGDFGLDVGLYFVTMAQLTGAALVYAALSVVAMVHFSSEEYSGKQAGVRFDLRGSAACTIRLPVFAYDKNFMNSSALLRNDCPLDAKQGYADMAGVLLLFLLLFILGKAQDKAAEYLETQIHSARPYTVKVSSPDPLADDPDRWRRLFAQFGHVSYVTVCRGNGALLRSLVDRRMAGRKLEGSTANVSEVVEAYKAVDERQRPKAGPGGWWKALLQPLGLFRDTNYWKQELWSQHDRVEYEVMRGMHDQGLPVVKVFITFESDVSKARCLSHMSRGILEASEEQHMYTNPDGFKESLNVMPASPASEVVYDNLHVKRWQRLMAELLSFALTAAVLALGYLAAMKLEKVGNIAVAVVIIALDAALPKTVFALSSLERHHNCVSQELSVMNKLTLARWVNMVGIPFLLNDRMGTLSADNLELVATVLWLNVIVPPALRLLDIRGRWSRNVLARKEIVQSAMDAHFRGTRWSLTERYTDTTKTIFACLVYTPVLPLAMWLCFVSLALSYWADKFLFMRVWRTPHPSGHGGNVAKLARRHLALAVLAHCVFALYYYAGWPFDHICRFEGGWVECSQEGTGLVEAETQSWMTGEQKTLVDVFSALNIAWLAILLVFYYLQSILAGLSLVIKGAPRKGRSRQHVPFTQLTNRFQHEVDAYVPQISREDQALPLLACDLEFLEPEVIPWKVDGRKGDSFEDHCLSSARDLPRISRYQRARLFSLCVHYPPPAPFEGIGNGRSSNIDMDWFRRPPVTRQETKVPEAVDMSEIHGGHGHGGQGGGNGNNYGSNNNSAVMHQQHPQQRQDGGGREAEERVEHHERDADDDLARSPPGLVDGSLAEGHLEEDSNATQAGRDFYSAGHGSGVPSSFQSRESEDQPMMPGGAQSSLMSSSQITAVGGADQGLGLDLTRRSFTIGAGNGYATRAAGIIGAGDERGGTIAAARGGGGGGDVSLAGGGGGDGRTIEMGEGKDISARAGENRGTKAIPPVTMVPPTAAGRNLHGGPSPVASVMSFAASALSGLSGRKEQTAPRIEHGDEESEIGCGEDADEYATRRLSMKTFGIAGVASHANGNGHNHNGLHHFIISGATMTSMGHDCLEGVDGIDPPPPARSELSDYDNDTPNPGGEGGGAEADDSYSFYDEQSHDDGREGEDLHDLPTPTPVQVGHGGTGVKQRGWGSERLRGEGEEDEEEESEASDGWVDQYTNSSLSRDDLLGLSHAPSMKSIQDPEHWRKARLTPAV